MKRLRYLCTHCGHRFESEEKEILECPNCFWSTSVKREDEIKAEDPLEKVRARSQSQKPRFSFPVVPVLLLFFAAGIGWAIFRWAPLFVEKLPFRGGEDKPVSISAKDVTKEAGMAGQPVDPLSLLSEEQKAILYRRMELGEAVAPSGEEKQILERRVAVRTGLVERLPSPVWNQEQFEQFLEEQERFYRLPLPRSYRKKLLEGFEQRYLPSNAAFESGDLQRARDHWVEALIFPVYENDIRKHRGVVLTMLRPFINDTLSKIGVANNILVERQFRGEETSINEAYDKILQHLTEAQWPQAMQAIEALEDRIRILENPKSVKQNPPPYPASVTQVDADIQPTLYNLYEVPLPAVADFGPIKQDMQAKRGIVRSLLPEERAAARKRYDEAVQAIEAGEWEKAENELKKINFPAELAEDSRKKIAVIREIRKSFS